MVTWDDTSPDKPAAITPQSLRERLRYLTRQDRLGISKRMADKLSYHQCPACGKVLTWGEFIENCCGNNRDFLNH